MNRNEQDMATTERPFDENGSLGKEPGKRAKTDRAIATGEHRNAKPGSEAGHANTQQVIVEEVFPEGGRRFWLRHGQQMMIGRTDEADLSFPEDHRMSHVHFAIDFRDNQCHLSDLDSTNGTTVNDSPVRSALLCDGDVIRAGDTGLRIKMHGDPAVAPDANVAAATVQSAHSVKPFESVGYRREALPDGVVILQGDDASIETEAIAQWLGAKWPLFMLVDFSKLDQEISEQINEPDFLLDWIPESAAALISPIVISPQKIEDGRLLLEKAWTQNALLYIFSCLDKADLLHVLRAAVRGEPVESELSERPDRMIGFYMPGILDALLRNGPPGKWNDLFPGIEAILMENQNHWQMLLPPGNEPGVNKIGMHPVQ